MLPPCSAAPHACTPGTLAPDGHSIPAVLVNVLNVPLIVVGAQLLGGEGRRQGVGSDA